VTQFRATNRTALSFDSQLWQFWQRYSAIWDVCSEGTCELPAVLDGNTLPSGDPPLCFWCARKCDPKTKKHLYPRNRWKERGRQ
jgi:hypothetical protein